MKMPINSFLERMFNKRIYSEQDKLIVCGYILKKYGEDTLNSKFDFDGTSSSNIFKCFFKVMYKDIDLTDSERRAAKAGLFVSGVR